MRKFFETLSVFVANVLRLKPTSWTESQQQVTTMKEAVEMWRFLQGKKPGDKVEDKGGLFNPASPVTPFVYLSDAILAALGFVLAVWLLVKIIGGFLAFLPFLLMLAALAWALGTFAKPKGQNLAS